MKKWVAGGCGAVGCVVAGVGVLALAGGGYAVWNAQAGSEEALRAALTELTGDELTFESLEFGWTAVTVRGAEVHRAGKRIARVDSIVLYADPSTFSTDTWDVRLVEVEGVHGALALGPDGWELPPRTMALVQQGSDADVDWPKLAIADLVVVGVDSTAESADGQITATVESATVGGISASMDDHGLTLGVQRADALNVDVRGEQPIAHVEHVTLDTHGRLTADNANLRVTAGPGGRLVLPPVVIDYAPRWLGGRVDIDPHAPWLGISLAGLPWQPVEAHVTGATVELTDGALVRPAIRWVATVSSATAGPSDGERIPVSAGVAVAGGSLQVSGSLQKSGSLALTLALANADAPKFTPYIQESLDHYGLQLDEGEVASDVGITLAGGHFTANGNITAGNLSFSHPEGKTAITALAANAATGLLGKRRTYTLPVRLDGDLDDPNFQPVRAVVAGLEDTIFASVGGAFRTGKDAAMDAAAKGRDAALAGANAAKDVAVTGATAAKDAAVTGGTAAKDAAVNAGQKAVTGVKEKLKRKNK